MMGRVADNSRSLVHVGYREAKYPLHTANLRSEVIIPFPDMLGQEVSGNLAFDYHSQHGQGLEYLDPSLSRIDGVNWPEAQSASLLLQQLSLPNSLGIDDRNGMTELIMEHTINLLAGKRNAAVGTNFM